MFNSSADVMLKLVQKDGYCVGETVCCNPDRESLAYHVDAAKDGERWVVTAPTRFGAATILLEQLGWAAAMPMCVCNGQMILCRHDGWSGDV